MKTTGKVHVLYSILHYYTLWGCSVGLCDSKKELQKESTEVRETDKAATVLTAFKQEPAEKEEAPVPRFIYTPLFHSFLI